MFLLLSQDRGDDIRLSQEQHAVIISGRSEAWSSALPLTGGGMLGFGNVGGCSRFGSWPPPAIAWMFRWDANVHRVL